MSIKGNDELLAQLSEILHSGRLFHACIITGPRGSGKKTLARHLAAAAVCTGTEPPCGHCDGCVKAEKDIHPDIERTKRERGEITVEQIRSLRASLYTRANEAPRRVSIVEEADNMNRNAQNALLTVLEEPPAAVLLILVAENEAELLPTIRSRCVRFRMSPLSEDQIIEELLREQPDLPRDKVRKAAQRSAGYLGRAQAYVAGEDEQNNAKAIVRALAKPGKKELIRAVLPLDGLKREQIAVVLEDLREILASAATVNHKNREYYPTEEETLLSERLSVKEILRLCRECERLYEYCDANVGTGHITGALISLFSEDHC